MPVRETLINTLDHIQAFLFPMLREEVGPLTAQHERLVMVLSVARIEAFVQMWSGLPGRRLEDRHALARAFVAKAVLDLAATSGLIERFWLFMKRKVLHNKYYAKFADFRAAFEDFFAHIGGWKEELESLLTPKFHFIGAPANGIP